MNENKRENIIIDHPNLYRNCKNFECLDGWLDIIYELSDALETLIKEGIKKYPDEELIPHASQVKEKCGTLRFYMDFATDAMYKLIEEAENKSEITCEICGNAGKLKQEKYWYRTGCDEH
jgi:hypothetical protein